MSDTVENLILDLLEWVALRERTYPETMDAWRTSCPRFPVWEDAKERGLVEMGLANGCSFVRVTPAGFGLLKDKRPRSVEALRAQGERERGNNPVVIRKSTDRPVMRRSSS